MFNLCSFVTERMIAHVITMLPMYPLATFELGKLIQRP
jgi:hypothetical protein